MLYPGVYVTGSCIGVIVNVGGFVVLVGVVSHIEINNSMDG